MRVDCPKCGRPVPEPLPRGALVPVVHSRGGRTPCRFWIVVAPRSGVKHRVLVLENRREGEEPEGQTFEGTARSIVPEYRRLLRRSVLQELLAEEQQGAEGREWEVHP